MSKDESDNDTEEEILVYAEFDNTVNIEKYRAFHVLGASDKNPIIQMDETFFMGKYENPLGTYMFFDNDPEPQSKDPLFDKYPEKCLKYVCKTRKLLSMDHAYVTPKEGKEPDVSSQLKTTDNDVKPVAFKDLEEATNAFKSYYAVSKETSVTQNEK